MRQRHALYLSQAMSERLQVVSESHRLSKSQILETALQRYLANDHTAQANDLRNLQQDATSRSLRRIERDLAIVSELMATFVRYFVTITPPLPESEHAAARALGQIRFEQVIAEIARRMRTDRSLMARVAAKLGEPAPRTATNSPGQADENAAPPSEPVPRRPDPEHGNG
jgi:predicted transcriptional regulator